MLNLSETQKIKDTIDQRPSEVQEIINETPIGICVTDENGLYAFVNDSYIEIVGYSRAELIGNSFLMVVPTDHKTELTELHEQFIETQIEIFEEFKIIDKHKNLIKISVDAGFCDKINDAPHKITFIQKAD
jgi:PAS domain S-box-containing protein